MSTDNQRPAVCTCCARRFKSTLVQEYPVSSVDFTLLQNNDLPSNVLPTNYNFEGYNRGLLDPKGLTNPLERTGLIKPCKECRTSLKANKIPKYSLTNWLYYGHDRLPHNVTSAFKSISRHAVNPSEAKVTKPRFIPVSILLDGLRSFANS